MTTQQAILQGLIKITYIENVIKSKIVLHSNNNKIVKGALEAPKSSIKNDIINKSGMVYKDYADIQPYLNNSTLNNCYFIVNRNLIGFLSKKKIKEEKIVLILELLNENSKKYEDTIQKFIEIIVVRAKSEKMYKYILNYCDSNKINLYYSILRLMVGQKCSNKLFISIYNMKHLTEENKLNILKHHFKNGEFNTAEDFIAALQNRVEASKTLFKEQ